MAKQPKPFNQRTSSESPVQCHLPLHQHLVDLRLLHFISELRVVGPAALLKRGG